MHIHQEKLSQSVLLYGCCPKLILEQGDPHERGWSFFAMKVFVSAGGSAEAMEPHAYHKAEYWDEDDSTKTVVHSVSFRVEWRMDVFQDVKALKEHIVDSEAATIIGTATKIVKQVSKWRPAGITRFRLEPRAAVLTPKNCCNDKDNEKHIE